VFLKLFDPAGAAAQEQTAAAVVEAFLRAKEHQVTLGTYSPRSLETCRVTMAAFIAAFGARLAADVRQADLISWIAAKTDWKSPHTKTHRMGFVVSAFRWAANEGLIERCVLRRDSSHCATLKPRTAIDPDDFPLFYRTLRKPTILVRRKTARAFRRAIWFLWCTGARTGEMRRLRWRDIDLDSGAATLVEHKTDADGHERHIALPRVVRRYLGLVKARTNPAPDALVFPNGRGRAWTNGTLGKQFRRYARAANLKHGVTAYSLRHGFCLRCLESSTLNTKQIADLMGHANTKLVDWYAANSKRRKRYLKDLIDRM